MDRSDWVPWSRGNDGGNKVASMFPTPELLEEILTRVIQKTTYRGGGE